MHAYDLCMIVRTASLVLACVHTHHRSSHGDLGYHAMGVLTVVVII